MSNLTIEEIKKVGGYKTCNAAEYIKGRPAYGPGQEIWFVPNGRTHEAGHRLGDFYWYDTVEGTVVLLSRCST